MPNIEIVNTGLIYRNPNPHLHAIDAVFPSVVRTETGEMLASFSQAEAFEAVNAHTYLSRSQDGGQTWQLQGELYASKPLTSDTTRLTITPTGQIVALINEHDRSQHPDEGPASPENMGCVPSQFLILRSDDYGHSWAQPQPIEPPLTGPCFELCSPIVPLSRDHWLLPTSTWRDWDGYQPNGMKMVAFVSHDQGATWPEYVDVMSDPTDNVIYWESKIIELPDGRLLAGAWAYDEQTAQDLPNQYALSQDGGATWSDPISTELIGQTMTPFALEDGRILTVYRRMDKPGLWANLSHLQDDQWVNESCEPLWGANIEGLTASTDSMADNFHVLRFGAPCITHTADQKVFVAFWGYEQCVANIRWFKLEIS